MTTRRRWGYPEVTRRYALREHPLSLASSLSIEGEHGEAVFKLEIDDSRSGQTIVFWDRFGHQLCALNIESAHSSDALVIERGGIPYATVRFPGGPSQGRGVLEMPGGDLEIRGNVRIQEYVFQRVGHRVAKVSKDWPRTPDTYTVEIVPGQEDAVILAATIAIEYLRDDDLQRTA